MSNPDEQKARGGEQEEAQATQVHKQTVGSTIGHGMLNQAKRYASPFAIFCTAVYLFLVGVFLLYVVVTLVPSVISSEGDPNPPVFFAIFPGRESHLLLVVAASGALGSLLHALRSLVHYLGTAGLEVQWLPRYIIMPIVGSILGTIFYLVLRGGFFSSSATIEQTNPFAFMGLAGLVGLFSEQATEKLKIIAQSVFVEPEYETVVEQSNNNRE
jgi:hypothetical protein